LIITPLAQQCAGYTKFEFYHALQAKTDLPDLGCTW